MVVSCLTSSRAEKRFVIAASRGRVWDFLGSAIYHCLPLERVNIVSETTLYCMLRWEWLFIKMLFPLQVKIVDLSPNDLLTALIRVRKWGLNLGLKVSFQLNQNGDDRTEVVCTASEEGTGRMGWFLTGLPQRFAEGIFDSVRVQLERLS